MNEWLDTNKQIGVVDGSGPSLLIDIFPTSSYEGPSLRKPKDFMKRNIEDLK